MLGKGVDDDDDDDDANKEMEKDGADTERGGKSLRLNYRYYSSVILARDFSTGRCGKVWAHIERSLVCMCVRVCTHTIDARKVTLLEESFSLFFCQLCLRIVS